MFLFYCAWGGGGENVYNVLGLYPKQLIVELKMVGFLVPFLLHLLLEVAVCEGGKEYQGWSVPNREEGCKKTWRTWLT